MSYSKLPFFSEEMSEFILKRVDQFDPVTYSSCITVSKSWSSFFINLKHDTLLGCHIVRISSDESLDDVIKCNSIYILKNNEIFFCSPLNEEPIKLEFKNKDSCFVFNEYKENFKFDEYQLLTTKNLNLIKAWTGHTPYVENALLYI